MYAAFTGSLPGRGQQQREVAAQGRHSTWAQGVMMGSLTRALHLWQAAPCVMAASTCSRGWPGGTQGLWAASTACQGEVRHLTAV